ENCVALGVGVCDIFGTDYGVITDSEGALYGEAWSENVGWICFGSTCDDWGYSNAPDATVPSVSYDGIKISGWAYAPSLNSEGWIRLQGDAVSAVGKSGNACFDCLVDDNTCEFCFTAGDLSGDVCYDCSSCDLVAEPHTCVGCNTCNQYGLAVDSTDNQIYGWIWGGYDNNRGIGWIKSESDFGTIYAPLSWLQIKYGDVYTGGDINAVEAPYGRYNSTYCINAYGSIGNFSSENSCELENLDDLAFPNVANLYTNILGKIDRGNIGGSGILGGKYGEVVTVNKANAIKQDLENELTNSCAEGKIYYFTGNLTIDQAMTFNNGQALTDSGRGLIVVDGDLNIDSDIFYENASVSRIKQLASIGWLVQGDLVIASSVSSIVGSYYIEGAGGVSTGSSDISLKVYGLMIAKDYNFQRTYQNIAEGSEQIIYDGRALVNTPPGMEDLTKALPLWREATP
ncbi:hypothetical protein ACFL23_04925, partial [Patescibacteria group bacterium]